MNPNDNQPIDPSAYLNQIAPKTPRKIDFLKQKSVIIGILLGAAVLVFILLAVFASLTFGNTMPTERLAARLIATQDTTSKSAANIKSSELRALNSNLKLYLANTIRDIKPILATKKVDINKLNKSIVSDESNTKTLATLEDARLNAIYDRTYARETAYQLNTILTLMREIDNSTNSSSTKTFLDGAIKNLVPTQKQFADFNAANS